MHKWLAPSSVNFLKMHRQMIVDDDTDDSPVNELSRKLAAEEMSIKVPKMQVSEKDGQMFALNNSSLQLMRQLEKQGKLQRGLIQVEVVPLSKVPTNIQMGMIADIETCFTNDDYNRDGYLFSNDQCQPDSSKNSLKKRVILKSESDTECKTMNAQGGNQTDINQASDEESEDEEDEEEVDDNEEHSSDSSTSDETMQCNVCDRILATATLLAKHQLKKKHFGCSVCDTVFPSLRALEEHKETLEHWSDDNPLTDDDNDEQNTIVKPQREEMERLL